MGGASAEEVEATGHRVASPVGHSWKREEPQSSPHVSANVSQEVEDNTRMNNKGNMRRVENCV